MEADTQRNSSCSTAARIRPRPAHYDSLPNRDNLSAWQSGEKRVHRVHSEVPKTQNRYSRLVLNSGRTEPLLPGFAVAGDQVKSYDVDPDGKQIVVSVRDSEGKLRLWVAPLDRRTPPRQIPNVEGHQPFFGSEGEIFFRAIDGSAGYAYRVRPDGTESRRVISQPIIDLKAVSPDGQWLVVSSPIPGETSIAKDAYPLGGGEPIRIASRTPNLFTKWSHDSRLLYLSVSRSTSSLATGTTYGFPVPPGRMFPDFPQQGLSEAEMAKWPGVVVFEVADFAPSPSPDAYAFSLETTQRNLYRIPIP
jgi:Tol biopolymer transport system component